MTDQELLELAAKAAGATKCEYTELPGEDYGFYADFGNGMKKWYPLTNDGDALRLAVKLQMEVAIFEAECHTRCMERGQRDWFDEAGDPYAATRRAIVKAAAEIGKAMK